MQLRWPLHPVKPRQYTHFPACETLSLSLPMWMNVRNDSSTFLLTGVTKLQDQIGVVNQARTTNQSALCPSWLDGYNTASGYGSVVAYPASRLILTCNSSISASYTCTDSTSSEPESSALIMDGGVDVQNFWSTSAVNGSTGQPLATLLLNAQLLDMLGQIMPVGRLCKSSNSLCKQH